MKYTCVQMNKRVQVCQTGFASYETAHHVKMSRVKTQLFN